MNAEVVNKFLGAISAVLGDYFSIGTSASGPPQVFTPATALEPVSVLVELSGDLVGQFVLGFQPAVALSIARAMLFNPEYPELDGMCQSALAELGNMIAGMTSTSLSELGHMVNVAPPLVVTGSGVTVRFAMPVVLGLPVKTSVGDIRVCMALQSPGG